MKTAFLKARLILFLLHHHLSALLAGELTATNLVRSLRKQMIVSSLFRDAKYSQVGRKIFIDPFAPYFPSPYCKKLFNNNTEDSYPPKPNFAQISITNRCPCRCVHCHVMNTQDSDLPKETILKAIEQISEADFPLMFFVGGEPMSRFDDLFDFVDLAKNRMDTRIFTSAVGSNPERLKALRETGLEGICLSLDHHVEAVHNLKRNHPFAFRAACDTIREASSIGFYVSVVCCTTSSMVRSGDTFKVVDLAESLGAHSIQLCTGWSTPGFDVLVALAGSFRHEGEIDSLLPRIGAISSLKGIQYWSTTEKAWRPLVTDAYALTGTDPESKRRDFAAAQMAKGRELFYAQSDNRSGKTVYRLRVLDLDRERAVLDVENVTPLRMMLVPLFGAGDLQSVYFPERRAAGVWGFYSLSRARAGSSLLSSGTEASYVNRAVAFYRHVAAAAARARRSRPRPGG